MSEFKREERYIVVKLKHLAGLQVAPLRNFLRENRVPTLDCVVVESDWPEYDKVWQSIERRMTGQPAVTAAEELEAVLHWRGKHTQAIRERGALQVLLNAADELADHNARVSAIAVEDVLLLQKRVDVLEGLLLQTNELLYAIQGDPGAVPSSAIDAMRGEVFTALKPAERTNTSGKAHCPHDGICHTSNETCAEAMARVAQFNDDHDGRPERDD